MYQHTGYRQIPATPPADTSWEVVLHTIHHYRPDLQNTHQVIGRVDRVGDQWFAYDSVGNALGPHDTRRQAVRTVRWAGVESE